MVALYSGRGKLECEMQVEGGLHRCDDATLSRT